MFELAQAESIILWRVFQDIGQNLYLLHQDLPKKTDIIAFYPNPVRDMLSISLDSQIETVEVFEMSGKKIKEYSNVNNFQLKISFSELLPITYWVKIKTKNEVKTVKIVKNSPTKRKQRNFICFLLYTTLKGICSKIEYDEPNQAFNGKKSQSCPSYTLEPLFKL